MPLTITNTGVVRENIELLVECENYDTFFNLIEELFEWDEKYTCKTLLELSKKIWPGLSRTRCASLSSMHFRN